MSNSTSITAQRINTDLLAPIVFVLLWSTGFIGAKLGLPYAGPLTFLLLRFVVVAVLMVGLVTLLRMPWPSTWAQVGHSAVVGILLQGLYLGGVFSALHLGMTAGIASLIVGLQPLLTSLLGQALLRESVAPRQWLGLLLGLGGVGLVLGEPLLRGAGAQATAPPAAIATALLGLVGGTLGTLYQRRFGRTTPLLSGTSIQFVAAAGLMAVAALGFETLRVQWTPQFMFALAWLVLVLSFGATLLLMLLIRRTTAARVSSLFYLVPPATAIEAYVIFDERLGLLALAGLGAAAVGVALVLRGSE
jgi:drug/metabolite transporter (DMT)-like permease